MWLVVVAGLLLAIAAFRLVRFGRGGSEQDDLAYFYDLSEKKLFTAPRTSVPPIRGLNNAELDAMRAVVIATSSNKKDRKVAYLEKYAPELKQQIESMQRNPGILPPGSINRSVGQALIFVSRLPGSDWFPVNSLEGQKIMTEWQVPGPGGALPVVCNP